MKHNDERFKVHIKSGSVDIVAEMPNDINVAITQEYENPFKLASNVTLQHLAQRFLDQTLSFDTNQLFTWVGGSALQLSIELEFVAEDSSYKDIVYPVRELIRLSVPRRNENWKNLRPPITQQGNVSVSIGKMLYMSQVLITSVNPILTRPILKDGVPLRVPFAVTLQTRYIPTRDRIDQIFFKDIIG